MNTVELKDNHLHITYESYPGMDRKIIPVEDIECIKARVGVRGGMHTWDLRGHEERYKDLYDERDVPIFSGDRKNADLIDKIMEVLPKLKYHEKVESGGTPW